MQLSYHVCFPLARIRFTGPTISPALFYVGKRREQFEKAFAGIGVMWIVPKKGRIRENLELQIITK